MWRSNIREAINRATNETNNRRVTRGQDAVNLELQSVLRHRHITINVQLEFDEDCDSLYQFKTLLTESRDHLITLNLNLGFIDSHGPFEENGLVFKEEDEDMEELVTELISWKDPRCTVNMSYMTGCICGGNDLVPSIKYALEHLTEVTEANDINFTHTKDFPKGWPRWIVQSNRLASWNWSRSRAIRRMDIDSA